MSYIYTESTKKARMKYEKEKLHRVPLSLLIRDYNQLKALAEGADSSVNGYIKKALSAYSGKDFSWDEKSQLLDKQDDE